MAHLLKVPFLMIVILAIKFQCESRMHTSINMTCARVSQGSYRHCPPESRLASVVGLMPTAEKTPELVPMVPTWFLQTKLENGKAVYNIRKRI